MLTLAVQITSETIYCCDTAADIAFIAVMAAEGIKVVPNICVILNSADTMFSCLIHKVIIQKLMYLPCICLEMGAT